jgi:hypothetical protein
MSEPYYWYDDQGGRHYITRSAIIAQCYPWWAEQMQRIGKGGEISEETCVEDFIVCNWATQGVEMDHAFKTYRKKSGELRPYVTGEDMAGISVSHVDAANGSPKEGDMIARNPVNHDDQWLVAKQYFTDNFEVEPEPTTIEPTMA